MRSGSISDTIEAAIRDPGLQDATAGLAEIILDTAMDEGTFRDIPVLGTLLSMTRTVVAIRDRLFLNKLCHFLAESASIPAEARARAIRELQESQKRRISVGEKVLYIVDRCQDHRAAQKIGRVFRAFLEGSITYGEFVRLAICVDRLIAEDLDDFLGKEWHHTPAWQASHLMGTGLIDFDEAETRVREQWDWKAGEKFVVENGDQTVSLSAIGAKLKRILGPDSTEARGPDERCTEST